MRTAAGFRLNFECGREIVQREFRAVLPWYLPPEFMLNNEQVTALAEWGVAGTFVNADRFKDEVQRRLPPRPYLVSGVLGGRLPCVPFAGRLADAYLDSLHRWSGAPWNEALGQLETDVVYSWRDGESFLLLPDGEAREACWLEEETPRVQRTLLSTAVREVRWLDPGELSPPGYRSYPVHSFANWFREFRMLGFLGKVQEVERRVETLTAAEQVLFLQTINSDILSAVEKDSPVVRLRTRPEREGAGEEAPRHPDPQRAELGGGGLPRHPRRLGGLGRGPPPGGDLDGSPPAQALGAVGLLRHRPRSALPSMISDWLLAAQRQVLRPRPGRPRAPFQPHAVPARHGQLGGARQRAGSSALGGVSPGRPRRARQPVPGRPSPRAALFRHRQRAVARRHGPQPAGRRADDRRQQLLQAPGRRAGGSGLSLHRRPQLHDRRAAVDRSGTAPSRSGCPTPSSCSTPTLG